MIELPEVKKVPDLGLGPRQFRRNEQPDFSDRSSWTKTPNDGNQKPQDKPEDHRRNAEKRRRDEAIAKRDAEQEEMARKHKKLHKRDKSLLEMHEKKLKKEKVNEVIKVVNVAINCLILYFFDTEKVKRRKGRTTTIQS
jgi:hypothetical protein